jgi:hypothetical protein
MCVPGDKGDTGTDPKAYASGNLLPQEATSYSNWTKKKNPGKRAVHGRVSWGIPGG